jgi:hypothetical protein
VRCAICRYRRIAITPAVLKERNANVKEEVDNNLSPKKRLKITGRFLFEELQDSKPDILKRQLVFFRAAAFKVATPVSSMLLPANFT